MYNLAEKVDEETGKVGNEWYEMKKVVEAIDEQAFHLGRDAERNAMQSVDEGEGEFNVGDTGVTQVPEINRFFEGNYAFYRACIGSLISLIEDMYSDNYYRDECGIVATPKQFEEALKKG